MSAVYVIDGYNLLFAMGVLHGRAGPHGLEKARLRLLGLLHGVYGDEADAVTVVFDAAHAPPGVAGEQEYQGLHIRFAVAEQEADDVIELLIGQAAAPKNLTVVSDDHRIQQAARRRQCTVQGCQDYLDWLDQRRRQGRAQRLPSPEKPPGPSPADRQHWLAEFADLNIDPNMKDVFDPFGFEQE